MSFWGWWQPPAREQKAAACWRVSQELIGLLVNGVRVDFITPSRLLSLNKHPPVTSLTLWKEESLWQQGWRQEKLWATQTVKFKIIIKVRWAVKICVGSVSSDVRLNHCSAHRWCTNFSTLTVHLSLFALQCFHSDVFHSCSSMCKLRIFSLRATRP